MKHKLLEHGYVEQDEGFSTVLYKQLGPLLLVWHLEPEIRIDVLVGSGVYNDPFCTIHFVGELYRHIEFPHTVHRVESAILEMYKTAKGLKNETE